MMSGAAPAAPAEGRCHGVMIAEQAVVCKGDVARKHGGASASRNMGVVRGQFCGMNPAAFRMVCPAGEGAQALAA